MIWEFLFDKKQKTIFWQGNGEFGDEDLVQCQIYCENHPNYTGQMNQILDFSQVTSFQITSAGLWGFIKGRKEQTGGRIALVVSSNLGFGLGRMFENMQEGVFVDVHVFRERSAALRWLGLREKDWPWKGHMEGTE